MSKPSKQECAWGKFVAKMVGQPPRSRSFYLVRGQSHTQQDNGWWWEPQRHVRKTASGIVRQIQRDGCMNGRHLEVYEMSLTEPPKLIWAGRIQ